jgi:hypothetical protein
MNQPEEMPSAGNMEEWLKWAETKLALSFAVTLYFKSPPSAFAEGVLECYRRYLELCEPHLRWFSSATGKFRPASAKVLRIPFRRVPEALEHNTYWSWKAYAGEDLCDAAPWQFSAVLRPAPRDLSQFRAAFPVEMFAGDLGRFVALVEAFAACVPFFFGYAGFSFSQAMELMRLQGNEQLLVPAAMRFSGIEVEAQINGTALSCAEAIKGVNWLTLLGSGFVEKLGGKAALRAQLSEPIELHDLPAGLMIQAGPLPGIGDVNAGERLPLYREVHRVLTPIRVRSHCVFGGRQFGVDETRRWIGRFDD